MPITKRHCYLSVLFVMLFAISKVQGQNVGEMGKNKPFTISGSLSLGANYYYSSGIPNRRQPFFWNLSGAPVVSIYGVTLPFSFVISEQERRFSQPFNQYGVSPYYKWITLHAGYRNIRFSDYTLGGANFLGGGIELNPKGVRLGFIYGRFRRAIDEDSIAGLGRLGYIRPAYERMGYAAKVGVGNSRNYLDFIWFKAWDKENSITTVSPESQITPEENLAVGIKSHLTFFKNRMNFDFDAGGSLLTQDMRASRLTDSSAFPLKFVGSKLLPLNITSAFSKAVSTSLSYNFGKGSIAGKYQRIDPGYRSLGAYFFQNDLEQFTISPSFNVLQGRLSFNLSGGAGRDNLNNTRYATTIRKIYSANVNIVATNQLNINLDYSNFGVAQNRGVGDLFNDTTAMRTINASYGGVISYNSTAKNGGASHQATLSSYLQNTNDLNRFTEEYSNANTFITSLNYGLSLTQWKLHINTGATYNITKVYTGDIVNISPSINISKLFLKNKLRVTLSENLQLRRSNGMGDGFTSSTGYSIGYTISRHTFMLNGGYLQNRYKVSGTGIASSDFSEFRSNIGYSIRF